MATYYMDPEGGNDANAGTSYALRRRKALPTLAGGDVVRYIEGPDPVNMGNATWTNGSPVITLATPATKCITEIQATGSVDASTDVFSMTAHGFATNDRIVFTKRDAGAGWSLGTVYFVRDVTTDTFKISTTAGGAAVNITTSGTGVYCQAAWVPSTNVTLTYGTSIARFRNYGPILTLAAGFTTGKVAYMKIPNGPLDLSAFTRLTFLLQNRSTVLVSGNWSITLCSDDAGVTAVDTFNFDSGITYAINVWHMHDLVKSGGGALGSSIRSIAIHVSVDPVTPALYLENFCAANADLTHQTLIGKDGTNVDDTDLWYIPQTFEDNGDIRINIAHSALAPTSTTPVSQIGYTGASGTATLYSKRGLNVVAADLATTAGNAVVSVPSGSSGNPIIISGGWDRDDMGNQTSRSLIFQRNTHGIYFDMANTDYVEYSKLDFFGGYNAINSRSTSIGVKINNCRTYYTVGSGIYLGVSSIQNAAAPCEVNNCRSSCNGSGTGIVVGAGGSTPHLIAMSDLIAFGSADTGIFVGGTQLVLEDCYVYGAANEGLYVFNCREGLVMRNCHVTKANIGGYINGTIHARFYDSSWTNNTTALQFLDSPSCYFYDCSTSGNTNFINSNGGTLTETTFRNLTTSDTVALNTPVAYLDSRYLFINLNGDPNAHCMLSDGGKVESDTSTRYDADGVAWKFSITDTSRNALYPWRMRMRGILCRANIPVTASIQFRRSSANISLFLVCPGQQIAGVPSEVISSAMTVTGSWQERSISFTPTEDGFIDLEVYCYDGVGTTNNGWWDSLRISYVWPLDGARGEYLHPGIGSVITQGLLPGNHLTQGGPKVWLPASRKTS